jgi:hypothetical protein
MNLLPIPPGSLGVIDGIVVREIRIPSKYCPLKQSENGKKWIFNVIGIIYCR